MSRDEKSQFLTCLPSDGHGQCMHVSEHFYVRRQPNVLPGVPSSDSGRSVSSAKTMVVPPPLSNGVNVLPMNMCKNKTCKNHPVA